MTTDLPLEQRVLALLRECEVVEDQHPHPRFSNATECLRMHVYDARAVQSFTWSPESRRPVRWNAAAVSGTALGEWMEKAARRLGAETQAHVHLDGDPEVEGAADIVWPDAVWDLKWVSEYAWKQAKRGPKDRHCVQAEGYAAALGKPKWAVIYLPHHMLGKGEKLEFLAYEGETDPRTAEVIRGRWLAVRQHADAGTLPDREHSQTDFECRVCRHRTQCWEST